MFDYTILQNRWLILSLGGGLVLVLGVVLAYIAIWRPRHGPGEGGERPSGATLQFMPWILVVTYLAILVYYLVGSTIHFKG